MDDPNVIRLSLLITAAWHIAKYQHNRVMVVWSVKFNMWMFTNALPVPETETIDVH